MALLQHNLSVDHSGSFRCIVLRSISSPKKSNAGWFSTCSSSCKLVVFSITTVMKPTVRKPCLPTAGLLSKPTTLITERLICTDLLAGHKLEFRYAKQPSKDFCDFIETTPKQEVAAFFRDIASELEVYRQLEDYHLKVRDDIGDFRVEVHFGDEERCGPEPRLDGRCILCEPDANLFLGQTPGMASGQCVMPEFSRNDNDSDSDDDDNDDDDGHREPYAVARLDYKGRCGFSIAPSRHVQKMSDLNDEELFALWHVAVKVLRGSNLPFISMILNQGTYRTLDHLVLKVWVENYLHDLYRSTWSQERKDTWARLQKLALNRPKKQRVCFFFRRNNSCRHGDFCSYLHES